MGDVGSETVEMDPRIWEALPSETLVEILAKLPLRSVCQLRSVCKEWNALFESPTFGSKWKRYPTPAPFCIMSFGRFGHNQRLIEENSFALYNPTSQAWYKLPVSSFAPSACNDATLLSSAGGLLLFRGKDEEVGRTLFIVNPMNKSERQLPSLRGQKVSHLMHYAKLEWCNKRATYDVFVLDWVQHVEQSSWGEWGISIYLGHIYNSLAESWQRTGPLSVPGCVPAPRCRLPGDLPYIEVISSAFHCDFIYCLLQSSRVMGCDFRVVRCANTEDANGQLWDPIQVGDLSTWYTYSHLFVRVSGELDKPLLMITGMSKSGWLQLWALDEDIGTWVKFKRIMQGLIKEPLLDLEKHFVADYPSCKWFLFNCEKGKAQGTIAWEAMKSTFWRLPDCRFGSYPRVMKNARDTQRSNWEHLTVEIDILDYNAVHRTPETAFLEWEHLQNIPRPLFLYFEPTFDVRV